MLAWKLDKTRGRELPVLEKAAANFTMHDTVGLRVSLVVPRPLEDAIPREAQVATPIFLSNCFLRIENRVSERLRPLFRTFLSTGLASCQIINLGNYPHPSVPSGGAASVAVPFHARAHCVASVVPGGSETDALLAGSRLTSSLPAASRTGCHGRPAPLNPQLALSPFRRLQSKLVMSNLVDRTLL